MLTEDLFSSNGFGATSSVRAGARNCFSMIVASVVVVCVLGVAACSNQDDNVAQNTQRHEAAVAQAVNYCVNIVRNTVPTDPVLDTYYQNFDAFYNPSSGVVQYNLHTVGDEYALFLFQKCMTEQGVPPLR